MECKSQVATDTMTITATNAAMGMSETAGPKTMHSTISDAPVRNVDGRVQPPETRTSIIVWSIVVRPPMPPKKPVAMSATPWATDSRVLERMRQPPRRGGCWFLGLADLAFRVAVALPVRIQWCAATPLRRVRGTWVTLGQVVRAAPSTRSRTSRTDSGLAERPVRPAAEQQPDAYAEFQGRPSPVTDSQG